MVERARDVMERLAKGLFINHGLDYGCFSRAVRDSERTRSTPLANGWAKAFTNEQCCSNSDVRAANRFSSRRRKGARLLSSLVGGRSEENWHGNSIRECCSQCENSGYVALLDTPITAVHRRLFTNYYICGFLGVHF